MLTIYHGKHTRSLRVVWLAEELGLHYGVKHTPFDPAALRTPEFLSVSPHGQLPAIEDGGTRMVESGAICQYLTEKYGKAPFKRMLGDADYPRYLQWLHAGEATLTPPLVAEIAVRLHQLGLLEATTPLPMTRERLLDHLESLASWGVRKE